MGDRRLVEREPRQRSSQVFGCRLPSARLVGIVDVDAQRAFVGGHLLQRIVKVKEVRSVECVPRRARGVGVDRLEVDVRCGREVGIRVINHAELHETRVRRRDFLLELNEAPHS